MAEDKESQTEAPSEKRLNKAREEGQVPVGRDSIAAAALATGAMTCVALAGRLASDISAGIRQSLSLAATAPFADLRPVLVRPWTSAGLIVAAAAGAAIFATVAQTRGGVWPHLAAPDLSRLWSAGRIKRLFSRELMVDLLLAAVKVMALFGAAYAHVRDAFMTLPALLQMGPGEQLQRSLAPIVSATRNILIVLILIAGIDLALTRSRFFKKLKMTRQEARREMREDEGDPMIRSRRKKRHRELTRAHVAKEVPRADALLVNPTHVAIAIRYRKAEGMAPRVLAKGKGALAEVMRELAREHGIPIVEDITLARYLYRKVKVGGQVPADTYKAVAAVLAFVYRLNRREQGAHA